MVDRLVYESKKSKVFRRQEDGSGTVTAVKVLNYEFPTPADIAQFHNEFDIISGLKLPGIRGPLRKAERTTATSSKWNGWTARTSRPPFVTNPATSSTCYTSPSLRRVRWRRFITNTSSTK